MDQHDHEPAGQVPAQGASGLDERERRIRQRERIADERDAATTARALRLRDLTARAETAIERAQRHIERSNERLGQSQASLNHCLDHLRWIRAELGSDRTSLVQDVHRTTSDGAPVDQSN